MWKDFPLLPERASTVAMEVDLMYLYLVIVCAFVGIAVVAAVIYFAIKYRKNEQDMAIQQIEGNHLLEITWSVLPLVVLMTMFGWGAWVYLKLQKPPKDAMDVYVVGKQWMWKVQHPRGQREINDLHVPIGQTVRLTITSEDVIHAYYIPAFRIKRDAVPGRYTQTWFEATQLGSYHIFCAEYCGTKHSQMIGTVHVLSEADYEKWLSGILGSEPAEEAGKKLFEANRCDTCHKEGPDARGPFLAGLFGTTVNLRDGGTAVVNPEYIRESIMRPTAKVVAGFEPVMPTYEGQLSEEQVLQIIAYIKSLKGKAKEAQ